VDEKHLPERLRAHLAEYGPSKLLDATATACSVLVALVPENGRYSVVYTLRSEHLPSHKGQVAFPGGKYCAENDDDLLATALREAEEEVGITPADVDVLGCLDDVYTMVTDYVITPFVGVLPGGYRYTANPGEVDDIFTVALTDLLDRSYHQTEARDWKGQSYDVDVITAGRHLIWGATHAITTNLIACLKAID